MRVLGIETSCDETGVAVYCGNDGLLGHKVYSQIEQHREYGGVVPELASRDHVRKILPLLDELLNDTGLVAADIDAVAYTGGPGLLGALLVGVATGQTLAKVWNVPALAVHHMEGHLLAPMLEDPAPEFPFLALLVSGGHTQLVDVQGIGKYELLGESIDDAAGEAFDKTAKMMGLPYPGGPELAAIAEQGDSSVYQFPRPMTDRPGLDFSFSGLKTFAMTTFNRSGQTEQDKANVARAFQDAVVDTMLIKCKRALKQTGVKSLVAAGGVSANTYLREQLGELMKSVGGQVYYPRHELCTDNAAMIAYSGYQRLVAGETSPLGITAKARWPMTDLEAV